MRFTSEQQAKILSVINKNWRGDKCEVCLTEEPGWSLIDDFIGTPVIPLSTGAVPMVGFICNVCGNIRLLSAMQLGLYPLKPGEEQSESPRPDTPKPEGAAHA